VKPIDPQKDAAAQEGADEALRDSEQRFRLLAEAMPQIVCMITPDGAVEYVNPTWIAFSGLDLAGAARAGWERIVHPDDLGAAAECRRRCLKTLKPQDVELRYRAADGTYRWFLSRLAPVVVGDRAARLVGAAMDIDDRKRAEEALRQSEARARAMGETLREADRRKDEFLGMLSHELRNPLAPIRNSVYILRHADPASEQAQRARDVIERQAEHLTRLVDDLLDVTRIARGKVSLRRARADLRELMLRAADDFRSVLRDRGVSFELDACRERLWSEVDPTRITQVMGNLLHNASKFTRAGDTVTVRLGAVNGAAELRVRDTGAGIDPALLPHVFEAFVQGERTLARTEGGLGLGLALVKGIVELHGGSVHVESAGRGAGAQFIVRLPLGPSAGLAKAPEPAPPQRSARRVLVVDDNVDAAESLAEVVRMLGHAVDVAYDGPGAIAKANAAQPDVVLCDIGLPGMSGYDVARALRARMTGVELFALSGYAQPDDVKAAIEAGFDGHVAKPASLADIERLLAI
jgi:PAS domain S-box-containing protein